MAHQLFLSFFSWCLTGSSASSKQNTWVTWEIWRKSLELRHLLTAGNHSSFVTKLLKDSYQIYRLWEESAECSRALSTCQPGLSVWYAVQPPSARFEDMNRGAGAANPSAPSAPTPPVKPKFKQETVLLKAFDQHGGADGGDAASMWNLQPEIISCLTPSAGRRPSSLLLTTRSRKEPQQSRFCLSTL